MLEQVLTYIHNRFECGLASGTFTVEGGELETPALDGQYVWIEGSVFNDGLHKAPLEGLRDETFNGTVYLLAIPSAVIDIAEEISDWQTRHADILDGPYQSESFGGYSYSKETSSGGGDASHNGWRAHFGARLIPWRKLS